MRSLSAAVECRGSSKALLDRRGRSCGERLEIVKEMEGRGERKVIQILSELSFSGCYLCFLLGAAFHGRKP